MYSHFKLAGKYLTWWLKASNSKGHGVHSPFVYHFIEQVLNDRTDYEAYFQPEELRKELLQDEQTVSVVDFGAGSLLTPSRNRKIKDIARASLKSKKFARLLFRIARQYGHRRAVEMGTSLGVTTCYLAAAAPFVTTMEGAPAIAELAQRHFRKAGMDHVRLVEGDFAVTLPRVLSDTPSVDLLFVDGNHRKEPTIEYFRAFLPKKHDSSVFIFDDIHWSRGMEEAWETICSHPEVTLSIDLFFIGLVFFHPDFKVKQHFSIRF